MSYRLSWNCPVGQVCMEYQNIAEGYDDRRNSTFDNFLFDAKGFAPTRFGHTDRRTKQFQITDFDEYVCG